MNLRNFDAVTIVRNMMTDITKEETMNPCQAKDCGKTDPEKPMAFKGEKWCSEKHRKEVRGDHTPQRRW
jgi:hypothetical protein